MLSFQYRAVKCFNRSIAPSHVTLSFISFGSFHRISVLVTSSGPFQQRLTYMLFRLRRGEHSNITVANADVGSDFIRFKENVVKTFHSGFTD